MRTAAGLFFSLALAASASSQTAPQAATLGPSLQADLDGDGRRDEIKMLPLASIIRTIVVPGPVRGDPDFWSKKVEEYATSTNVSLVAVLAANPGHPHALFTTPAESAAKLKFEILPAGHHAIGKATVDLENPGVLIDDSKVSFWRRDWEDFDDAWLKGPPVVAPQPAPREQYPGAF